MDECNNKTNQLKNNAVVWLTIKYVVIVFVLTILCFVIVGCEMPDEARTPRGYKKETISVCVKKVAYDLLKDENAVYYETSYEYDDYGNCIKEFTKYTDENRNSHLLTREYDNQNRIKESKSSEPDFTNWIKKYTWKDDNHVRIETSYPGQRTTSKTCDETYDDLGKVVSQVYLGGGDYSYVYNSSERLIEVIYSNEKKKAKNYHEYLSYDENGRKIEDRYVYENAEEDNSIWEYKYQTVNGALETTTIHNGEFYEQVIEEYDDKGNVVKQSRRHKEGSTSQYKYTYEYADIEVFVQKSN